MRRPLLSLLLAASAVVLLSGCAKQPRLVGDLSHNLPLKTGATIVVPETMTATNEVGDSQIYLIGKVEKPGVYPIKHELSVLHALFLAGGMAPDADPKRAFLVRGSTRTAIDLDRLIQEGDLSQNLTLKAGDTLTIPEISSIDLETERQKHFILLQGFRRLLDTLPPEPRPWRDLE